MLTLLSPAKTLDFDTPASIGKHTLPVLLNQAEALVETMKNKSPEDLSELMGISNKLALLNANRYQDWSLPFTEQNSKQAMLAFKGDVYTGFNVDQFDESDLEWSQDRIRILSGLYGVLKPLDLIQPYRLEMGTRLKTDQGDDLYAYWGQQLTESLNAELNGKQDPIVVNLASNEYFKSIDPKSLHARIITPVFKDWKNGKYKIISFFAKKARGMMAAYQVRERVDSPDKLKDFADAGYAYSAADSSDDEWVFLRRESA